MRRQLRFSIFALATALLASGSARLPVPESIGTISFILGRPEEVTVLRRQSSKWQPAQLKMPLQSGDQIQTAAEARCEVKLHDGSLVRLGERSHFAFDQAQISAGSRQVEGSLMSGKLWAWVSKLKWGRDRFEIKSPTAVCAVRGTIYRLEADSTTRVAVYDGQVEVGPSANLRQRLQQQPRPVGPPRQVPGPTEIPGPYEVSFDRWIRLVAGFQIEIRPNGRYAKASIDTTAEAGNDWVQWNRQRDREQPR
ncbi:MAG: FecR family protein [candidate division KSB1 bacterium]|nr:FecR family protein [candidate division KSB1 bacterium]MDZ7273805.1 FecR family protein [candidate division KSB1 bacterium]MDZ7285961.1 FecR family protein [candidate division KSB1 bacterium]MDZ7298993.1 FecR family protein [candidate division KSB1 bacterium]MDZ7309217.1 FecR family protein [candidate division KSB1 bacterium]